MNDHEIQKISFFQSIVCNFRRQRIFMSELRRHTFNRCCRASHKLSSDFLLLLTIFCFVFAIEQGFLSFFEHANLFQYLTFHQSWVLPTSHLQSSVTFSFHMTGSLLIDTRIKFSKKTEVNTQQALNGQVGQHGGS